MAREVHRVIAGYSGPTFYVREKALEYALEQILKTLDRRGHQNSVPGRYADRAQQIATDALRGLYENC